MIYRVYLNLADYELDKKVACKDSENVEQSFI